MTEGLQDCIVWGIVAAAFIAAGVRTWRLLCGRRKGGCASCSATQCPLKARNRK